jgi:pyruvate dehydrogenase E1 component beta subunit
MVKQIVHDNGEALPLDQCFTLREGSDITLVTWGALVHDTLQAAEHLSTQDGIEAEVIDVATISPLDFDTIYQSVEKTGRCVIIHEAPRNCGVGAEIAARLAETALSFLQAPIKRVTGYDTIMPYLQLEKSYLPNAKRILDSVYATFE